MAGLKQEIAQERPFSGIEEEALLNLHAHFRLLAPRRTAQDP